MPPKLEEMGRKISIALVLIISTTLTIQAQKIKVACLGNSITYGSGITNRQNLSYPAQLQYWLGQDYEVSNFGVSGATLLRKGNKPYWQEKAFANLKEYLPDIVIIKLGTNDSKPDNWQFKDEFKTDYIDLIHELNTLSSRPRLLLATPVPVFEDKWGITESVVRDEIAPMIKKIAKKENCDVVDLYEALQNQGRFFPDGVHPDPLGAELMVKEIFVKLFHKTSANNGAAFNTATHPVPSPEYRGEPAGWGAGNDWFSQHEAINNIKNNHQIDLVFLGNSITQAWGGPGRELWSPVTALWDSLYQARNAANFGISGDRTQHLLWRINNGNFDNIQPRAIVLTIGVNNFRVNTASEIVSGIKAIVRTLQRKLPSTEILLFGPLPAGAKSDDGFRKKYNEVHQGIAYLGQQARISYFNLADQFILPDGSLDYDLMRKDNIHLAPGGYHLWAKMIEPKLKEIFKD